ncbi:MAG: hypothetical protein WBG92_24330 [Thiohalocapsa sp.]
MINSRKPALLADALSICFAVRHAALSAAPEALTERPPIPPVDPHIGENPDN